MTNPIDSIQDDSFQIDPLLGSDSFISTDANQTVFPIQPSEQTEQKPVVLNPIPSSELDPIFDKVEPLVLNLIPSSELDPIFGEDVQANEQPLKLYPIPISKMLFLGSTDFNNWTMTCETQTSGASAGTTDRYYVDPTTGQRFRSKVEVKRYLETGSKNKSHSGADATLIAFTICSLLRQPAKTEKSGTKKTGTKKKEAGWSFDFENPPEEITWSLVDGTWKPSTGGEQVPEATVQEWAATFDRVCKME